MSITWFNEKLKELIVTISNNSLTLNKPACDLISTAYNVMLGINYDEEKVYIKPLNKDECLRGTIPESSRYAITIRDSYARISNKDFINQINKIIKADDLKDNPKKFYVSWDEENKSLMLDLGKEVK